MMTYTKRQKITNHVMYALTGLCAALTVGTLLFILGYLVWNGGRSLNWSFFTKLPAPVGEDGGGMANALLGSGKVLLLAAAMGIPAGFLGGVYLSEYGGKTFSFLVRYMTDLLNGIPSIVIGIVVYGWIVHTQGHFSTFAGGVALGIMMIPIGVRSTEEFLRSVPHSLREAAIALGAAKWQVVLTVVIPAAFRGIVTGMLLGLARVAGETAPLLFTALNNQFWSPGWNHPTATLPAMIFSYAISPYEDWHRQAWAAGFVLLTFVLGIILIAKLALHRRTE
jgi:phosphate transport system permease protein